MKNYHLSDIKKILDSDFKIEGKSDFVFNNISSPSSSSHDSLIWLSDSYVLQDDFPNIPAKVFIISYTNKSKLPSDDSTIIRVRNPKLTTAKITKNLFVSYSKNQISSKSFISEDVLLAENVSVGINTVITTSSIDNFVRIGNNCVLKNLKIGEGSKVSSLCNIGDDGFNFIEDKDLENDYEFPHIGKVIIGNNTKVFGNTYIARGVLSNTCIGNNVNIGQGCYIGANVNIHNNVQIRMGTIVCGSVEIGSNVIIGPNCTIRNGVTIGHNTIIGMGSNVVGNVPQDKIYLGNPAREKAKNLQK
tara:strand:+ start:247 stop:1155 length:909 start_codon:yes stop_codon:yes gene_type:complete